MKSFIAAIVALATMAACDFPSTPRSDSSDGRASETSRPGVPSYGVLGRCADPLDIRWHYDHRSEPESVGDVRGVIREAVSVWNGTGLVRISEAGDADSAHVVVSWHGADVADCTPFLDFEGSLAHARGVAGAEAAEIHLDNARRFARPVLLAALVHEFGHALGLGHSRDASAVMFPVERRRPLGLGASDLAGLRCLYGDGALGFDDGIRRVTVDLEGDGLVDELVFAGGEVQTFKRDAGGRVVRSYGPEPCDFDPNDPAQLLVTLDDGRTAILRRLADGHYRAVALDGAGRPSDPWYVGRPLRTKDGPMDLDGDGVLDEQ